MDNNCFVKKNNEKENMLNITPSEDDSLLVDLVKNYPHLYDKQAKDFKDTIKRNNSWIEIGQVLNATAFDCQTRWTRLRERYSREKKLRDIETRSGSGSKIRSSFPLYEQMNFLYKYVKSRRSITNISMKNVSEKIDSSNVPSNKIRSNSNEDNDNIINLPNKVLKTGMTSPEVSSCSSSISSVLLSPSHSTLSSRNINTYNPQTNMCYRRRSSPKHPISESRSVTKLSFDSDDFSSSHSPDVLNSDDEISSPLETVLIKKKEGSPTIYSRTESPNRKTSLSVHLDHNLSPALSSSSPVMSNLPKRSIKKLKHESSTDNKVEESFLRLSSAVSTHLESKNKNVISPDVTDEDDIFGKLVTCQLKKILEPQKNKIKGQIMKILYDS